MRTATCKVAVTAAAVLVSTLGTGAAQAVSPTTATPADNNWAPSACRPANHTARISAGPASAGHHHYRVTLTAASGYEPCQLAGSPTDVRFYRHGSRLGVTAGRYGPQHTVVTFGPGRRVHFDIQVPTRGAGTRADEVGFILRTPDGVIPGESSASGPLVVNAGTLIGPVQPGA